MSEEKELPQEIICEHCNTPIAIRNQSGFCDHLYYPEHCNVCIKAEKSKRDTASALLSVANGGIGRKQSDKYSDYKNMTAVEFIAVELKVPMSGTPWIDEMIEASRIDEFVKALAASVNSQWGVDNLFVYADALLAESRKKKDER